MIETLLITIVTAIVCYSIKRANLIGYVSLAGSILLAVLMAPLAYKAVNQPITLLGGLLYMDALSAYIASIVAVLAVASSAYSIRYMEHELEVGLINVKGIRRYYLLLNVFICTMLIVTMSNNLALMWIAIEATTIVSTLLIGLGFSKRELAIEAAWKYIILCSVGITFALLGTFIVYYGGAVALGSKGTLDWTELKAIAQKMNPETMKLAFIFVLVGYGTKAGLAPVHNWLPDAYTQAPSPISALLSGILSSAAFYGIMRFVSIVEPSTGHAFTGKLLIGFGIVSVGISAIFILVQENYKRLLAYSSIEHIGIVALGVGIGGSMGMYGSLLHILNHALSKPLMFYASGRIQSRFGSTRIERVSGVLTRMPLLGTLSFIGILSLAGVPPLNIFVSEFTILKAAIDKGMWAVVGLFLLFAVIIFYGMLSAFGKMLFGESKSGVLDSEEKGGASLIISNVVMTALAVAVIALGLGVPDCLSDVIMKSIEVLGVK